MTKEARFTQARLDSFAPVTDFVKSDSGIEAARLFGAIFSAANQSADRNASERWPK